MVIEEEFSDCSLPSTGDIGRGFDPTSRSAKGYYSGMFVASWSRPND